MMQNLDYVQQIKYWSVSKVKIWLAHCGFGNSKFLAQITRRQITGKKLLGLNRYQINFLSYSVHDSLFSERVCIHIWIHQILYKRHFQTLRPMNRLTKKKRRGKMFKKEQKKTNVVQKKAISPIKRQAKHENVKRTRETVEIEQYVRELMGLK